MSSLKHVKGRIVVSVNLESKNSHTFTNGTTIRLERQYDNFDRRYTQPVNAIVISAEYIPVGSEIIIHHNSLHDTNKIFNYQPLSGNEQASDIRYFSIPEAECYAWRDDSGNLLPLKGFAFGLRVYRPYSGTLHNIAPTLIPDVLYITTGKLMGQICHTLKAADYEMIFQGTNGREERVIRIRHSDDEDIDREEITAISHSLTSEYMEGGLMIGLSPSAAQKIKFEHYAQ